MSLTNENKLAYLQEGSYTTVSVSFLENLIDRRYTYKLHNSMVEAAKNNEYAIVPTVSGYKVVKIEEVHERSQLDYNKSYPWKWVVNIIDDSFYTAQMKAEKIASHYMSLAKVKKQIEEDIGEDLVFLRTQATI